MKSPFFIEPHYLAQFVGENPEKFLRVTVNPDRSRNTEQRLLSRQEGLLWSVFCVFGRALPRPELLIQTLTAPNAHSSSPSSQTNIIVPLRYTPTAVPLLPGETPPHPFEGCESSSLDVIPS
jgi:hypothetical protein